MSLHRIPLTRHTHSLSFPSFLLPPFRILCVYPYNLNSRRRRWRSLPASGVYHPVCVYLFNDELITQTFAAMFISVCKYAWREGGREGGRRSVPVISTKPYDWDRYHGPFGPFSPILCTPRNLHTYGRSVCQLHAYITPRTHTHTLSLCLSLCRVNFTRELNYSPRLRTRSIILSQDTLFVSWGGGWCAIPARISII